MRQSSCEEQARQGGQSLEKWPPTPDSVVAAAAAMVAPRLYLAVLLVASARLVLKGYNTTMIEGAIVIQKDVGKLRELIAERLESGSKEEISG